jgi:dihydrofolate reductase
LFWRFTRWIWGTARIKLDNPLALAARTYINAFPNARLSKKMRGESEDQGTTGVDNDFAERGFDRIGAWILGRNMFGPFAAHGRMTNGTAGG